MRKTVYFIIALLILAGMIVVPAIFKDWFYANSPVEKYEYHTADFPVMSTHLQISVWSDHSCEVAEVNNWVLNAMESVTQACNVFNPQSELSRLNETAAAQPFQCSPELYDILTVARQAYQLSGGRFDVTSGPLMRLWGFYRKQESPRLPTAAELQTAKKLVGLDKVEFNDADRTVFFTVPGMSIDLGGIAKGYAADLALKNCYNMPGLVVNLGGNLRFSALPPGVDNYPVAIRNPLNTQEICLEFTLTHGAVSTSGSYERYVKIDGRQYSHIMNPATAQPVSGILSVTVVAENAVTADYLSTAIFIGGAELAEKLSQTLNIAVYIITPASNQAGYELQKIGKFI